jgi:hypothetical protein
VDRAKRENDFTCRFGTNRLSLIVELNGHRAAAMEENVRRQCTSEYCDVWPIHERVHIGTEDRLSLSIADRFIDKRASPCRLHHATIRVRKALQSHRFSAFQQSEEEWVRCCCGLHVHHAARAAALRIRAASPRLNTVPIQVENGCITP